MEDYFNQPLDDLRKDGRPELKSNHVGFAEQATSSTSDRGCPQKISDVGTSSLLGNRRFFWHMSAALSPFNVVPSSEFLRERWVGTMDQWGGSMKNAYVLNSKFYISEFKIQLSSVADLTNMIAIGLDLPSGTFREAGRYGFVIFKILSTTYLLMSV